MECTSARRPVSIPTPPNDPGELCASRPYTNPVAAHVFFPLFPPRTEDSLAPSNWYRYCYRPSYCTHQDQSRSEYRIVRLCVLSKIRAIATNEPFPPTSRPLLRREIPRRQSLAHIFSRHR